MAGHDVFQTSTDAGTTWQPTAHNLPSTDIHGFALSPDDSKRLFANVAGHGLFHSADGGRTWEPLTGNLLDDVMTLAIGTRPEHLYAGSLSLGIVRSVDGGRTWERISGLPAPMRGLATGMAIAAVDQTVYAGVNGSLYKSTESGTSWRQLSFPGDNIAIVWSQPNTDKRRISRHGARATGVGLPQRGWWAKLG